MFREVIPLEFFGTGSVSQGKTASSNMRWKHLSPTLTALKGVIIVDVHVRLFWDIISSLLSMFHLKYSVRNFIEQLLRL